MQGTTSLIAGAFFYADPYGAFNFIILNQIEAGSRLMQQLDSVLQYCRHVNREQMAKHFKRCYNDSDQLLTLAIYVGSGEGVCYTDTIENWIAVV